MKKFIYILLYATISITVLASCQQNSADSEKLKVAVSIVPEETFVKEIAGDLVDIVTLIPTGASPSNYQPSPKEMTAFSESSVYFSIGAPTEAANIMPNIASLNKDILIVELDEIVDEVYPARYFEDEEHDEDANHEEDEDHDHEDSDHDEDEDHEHEDSDHAEHEEDDHEEHDHTGRDPHIWSSPKRAIIMVETIRNTLIQLDPNNKETYTANAAAYIEELTALDEEITATMDGLENKSFIIMHPSLGYFADDYGLEMTALEQDGKESTAKHLEEVIDFAVDNDIKVVFYQAEFDSQQAETLAREIDGETMEIAPLSPDYISNLREINETFKSVLD